MKKLLVLLLSIVVILTGCLNPASVRVIEDMYTQALMEEEEAVATYFSDDILEEHPIEELTQELASHPRAVGGISLLNAAQLTRNRLQPDIVEELDEKYDEEWHFVVNDATEGEVMTWVLLKTPTQYLIVEGEKVSIEEYQEHIKK